ncbi:LexA family protein [Acinetobacter sp. WCHAc010034]|uniref:LexA family protein n=1 Tax=Acinetobacter sp. WCHAc010034 TaxID=1879049 RepID=UPI00083A0F7E|nr:S24 family peptidase [Acinetobacter sp. WCHAc010034]
MNMIPSVVERIQKALDHANLSWSGSAVKIGLSAQAASKWKKGQISRENLTKLAKETGVSSGWLLDGEGEMLAHSSLGTGFSNVSFNTPSLRKIPVLDFVQAGMFHEAGYDGINPKGDAYTTYESAKPECVFSLEVSGLSMTPEFNPGDRLVVDASKPPYPGCYVIAQNGSHEATFKKYRAIGYDEHGRETFELIPLNPDFPTMCSTQQEIRIIGVVVEHLRCFKK